MLNFANIDRTAPAHRRAAESGLVLGFQVMAYGASFAEDRETLYCELSDGRHFASDGPRTNSFDPAGRQWRAVESIPDRAEFIGHYKRPRRLSR